MRVRRFLVDVAIILPVTFVVAALVTYLYSLIVHGAGAVNWETAFQLAFIVGIVLPLTRTRAVTNRER
jgi:hypothetical protein